MRIEKPPRGSRKQTAGIPPLFPKAGRWGGKEHEKRRENPQKHFSWL